MSASLACTSASPARDQPPETGRVRVRARMASQAGSPAPSGIPPTRSERGRGPPMIGTWRRRVVPVDDGRNGRLTSIAAGRSRPRRRALADRCPVPSRGRVDELVALAPFRVEPVQPGGYRDLPGPRERRLRLDPPELQDLPEVLVERGVPARACPGNPRSIAALLNDRHTHSASTSPRPLNDG